MRHRLHLALSPIVVVVALGATTLVALADDESDLVSSIQSDLDSMASYLNGTAGASSDSGIGSAIDYADHVRGKADQLHSLDLQTDLARTMAEHYSDWAQAFTGSAQSLRDLKNAQLHMKADNLAPRCVEAMNSLREEIKQALGENNPDEISALPDHAEKLADEPRRLLHDHEQIFNQGGNLRNAALSFGQTHDHWAGVTAKLHEGASETWDLVQKTWTEDQHECADLVKGKDSSVVVEALGSLTKSAGGRKELIESMKVTVGQIAVSVEHVVDGSPEDVDHAIELVAKVVTDLGVLEHAKGKDAEAQKVYVEWGKHVDEVKPALESLRKLKTLHKSADKLPELCTAAKQERGQALSNRERGAGRKAIEVAKQIGERLTPELATAEEGRKSVDSLRTQIHISASDEPWQTVATKLTASTTTIADAFVKVHETAKDKCEDVAKGEKSPSFLEKLKGQCTRSEVSEMDKPVDQFCKQSGKRSCDDDTPCEDVGKRVEINTQCLAARVDLRDWCQDPDHDDAQEIENTQRALEKCQQQWDARCR